MLYILFLIICSLFVNTKKEYEKDSPFYRHLLDSATCIILWLLRIKVHVEGLEQVPTEQKLLFVGNHRSCYDPIVTWYAFRKWKIAFISKPSNFRVFAFGRLIRKCCFMPIDRENPRNAIGTIAKAADLLKKQEVSIGVYPEGTRSKRGELLPFHNGVFKIAQRAERPVVVLAVAGTEHIAQNLLRFRASHIYLSVTDVIASDEIKGVKTEVIGRRVAEQLSTILSEKEREEHEQDLYCVQ